MFHQVVVLSKELFLLLPLLFSVIYFSKAFKFLGAAENSIQNGLDRLISLSLRYASQIAEHNVFHVNLGPSLRNVSESPSDSVSSKNL